MIRTRLVFGRHQLPVDSFVGRKAELDALSNALGGGVRLVSVVGPMGAGKTRLANELVRGQSGVVFFDLSTAFDEPAMFRALGATLDLQLGEDPTSQVIWALEALGAEAVVLDNLEQILGPARALVASWLETNPRIRIVTTTREALEIPGEVKIALGSLAPDEAFELFEDRARTRVAGFELEGSDRITISELLDALDRLPLVIELAAARADILPPSELARRLHARFEYVRSSRPELSPRQASLRGAIDWSWQLLDEAQRQALYELSVFRGGFGLDAAEAVLSGVGSVDRLQALVSKSLVRRSPSASASGVRFALYESVRAFVGEFETDLDTAVRAHADHYASRAAWYADALNGRVPECEQSEALQWFDAELDNLLAAIEASEPELAAELTIRTDLLLEARGPSRLRRCLLDRALRSASGKSSGAELLRLSAEAHLAAGRVAEARDDLLDARTALEGQPDMDGKRAWVELTSSRVSRASGDTEAAVRAASMALDAAEAAGVERLCVLALANRAAASGSQADLEQALRRARQVEDARLTVMLRNLAGALSTRAGRYDEARDHYRRALRDIVADRRLEAAIQSNLGLVEHYRGSLDEAVGGFRGAEATFRRIGLRREAAIALANRASVEIDRQRLDDAGIALGDALEILSGAGGDAEGIVVATLGNLRHARGDLEGAEHAYDLALTLLTPGSSHAESTTVYRLLAALAAGQDRARGQLAEIGREPTTPWGALAALTAGESAPVDGFPPAFSAGLSAVKAAQNEVDSHAPGWLAARLAVDLVAARRATGTGATDRVASRTLIAAGEGATGPTLIMDSKGFWFRLDGGERVDIRRRGPARLLLVGLAQAHVADPDRAFGLAELFELGWPGQTIDPESADKRVYAAIGTLRRLGLADVLITTDEGYLLDPATKLAYS